MSSRAPTFAERLTAPQPIERLALLRIVAPLAILGFLRSRMIHAEEWLGQGGFRVPELVPAPYSQPLYLPGLSDPVAWAVVAILVFSGLLTSIGLWTRAATGVFAASLIYVAWADRLSAFSVNKLGAVVIFALFFTPAGARWSLDAWRAARDAPPLPSPPEEDHWGNRGSPLPGRPTHVTWGNVRFFQALMVTIYCGSGIAKANGDWLNHDFVLWTHLHDTYQTPVSLWVANTLPAWSFTAIQKAVLAFELFAPLLFWFSATRRPALAFGLGMHLGIGLMFGPVIWFSLLMMSLLTACFVPAGWLVHRAPQS